MKTLPYFKWYPADAETDHLYASMNDAELGLFHRCLNRSWLNGGLPSDLDELAAIMRMSRTQFDKHWARVGRCFLTSDDGKTVYNRRQEEERSQAIAKSESATKSVRTRYERRTNDSLRAYVCVSGSSSDSLKGGMGENVAPYAADLDGQTSQRFPEFWNLYPRKQHKDAACHEWVSVVTVNSENVVFDCLARYLKSDEVFRGAVANPEKWLMEQHRDGWEGTWPAVARAPDRKESVMEQAKRLAKEKANGTH